MYGHILSEKLTYLTILYPLWADIHNPSISVESHLMVSFRENSGLLLGE